MPETDADSLLKILQFAISPAVLVTAVGLLLGPSMTRLGRAIDRCHTKRETIRSLESASSESSARLAAPGAGGGGDGDDDDDDADADAGDRHSSSSSQGQGDDHTHTQAPS